MIRGATYEIEITITNEDASAPLDLTNASGILVGLYGEGKKIFGKWSLVDKSAEGYGDVVIVTPLSGIISVALEAADSLKALEKMAKLEIVVALPNPDFSGNIQISIDTNIELELVERSIFEGVSAT